MRQIVRSLAAAAAVACAATVALAAEQTILGKALTVKDPKPGVDLTTRKVDVTGKEKNSPNTLVGNRRRMAYTLVVRIAFATGLAASQPAGSPHALSDRAPAGGTARTTSGLERSWGRCAYGPGTVTGTVGQRLPRRAPGCANRRSGTSRRARRLSTSAKRRSWNGRGCSRRIAMMPSSTTYSIATAGSATGHRTRPTSHLLSDGSRAATSVSLPGALMRRGAC
jgi:hypothetical protein